MPTRGGAATRAEKALARRRIFFQARVDQAGDPVEVISAGVSYLLSVVRRVQERNPEKATQIAGDTAEFLLRQANAHDGMTTTRGGKR